MRAEAGDHNAFIDPAGYKAYIADRKQAFEDELHKQLQVRVKSASSAASGLVKSS